MVNKKLEKLHLKNRRREELNMKFKRKPVYYNLN